MNYKNLMFFITRELRRVDQISLETLSTATLSQYETDFNEYRQELRALRFEVDITEEIYELTDNVMDLLEKVRSIMETREQLESKITKPDQTDLTQNLSTELPVGKVNQDQETELLNQLEAITPQDEIGGNEIENHNSLTNDIPTVIQPYGTSIAEQETTDTLSRAPQVNLTTREERSTVQEETTDKDKYDSIDELRVRLRRGVKYHNNNNNNNLTYDKPSQEFNFNFVDEIFAKAAFYPNIRETNRRNRPVGTTELSHPNKLHLYHPPVDINLEVGRCHG